MKITEDKVRYIAELANLKLSDSEVQKFQADLDEILVHIDRLSEIDSRIERALTRFLDPFVGGPDGRGWDFGCPTRSDQVPS